MSMRSVYTRMVAKIKTKQEEKKKLSRMIEVNRRMQVREFNNMLCLSLDGIPVLPLKDFNKQALSDARLTLYNYLSMK